MAKHETLTTDSNRQTFLRIAQHGGALLASFVIVAFMAHSFGVSIT
jgi:hypothetical protein